MNAVRILLVDDDEDLLLALKVRLTAQGFQVDVARDGASAVQMAAVRSPDLIVLDLRLPGSSGFQVLEKLRANPVCADIPVIVCSARDPHTHQSKALQGGAAHFLPKPVDAQALLNAISSTLEPRKLGLNTFASRPQVPSAGV